MDNIEIAVGLVLSGIGVAIIVFWTFWFFSFRAVRRTAAMIVKDDLNCHLEWADALRNGTAKGISFEDAVGDEEYHKNEAEKLALVLTALGGTYP